MRGNKTKYPGIYKLDENRYTLTVPLGKVFVPETGKYKYKEKAEIFRGKLADAKDHHDELRRRVKLNKISIGDQTVAQLFVDYFRHADAGGLEPSTAKGYRIMFSSEIGPRLGHRKLVSLSTREIDAFLDEVKARPGRNGKEISNASVNRYRSCLSSAFSQAVEWGMIGDNPAKRSRRRKEQIRQFALPPIDVISRMAQYFDDSRTPNMGRFLRLSLFVGGRCAEICALRIGDYNAATHELTIDEAEKGNGSVGDTKGHAARTFGLPVEAVQIIEAQIQSMRSDPNRLIPDTAFLFSDDNGTTPWRPGRITCAQRRVRERMCPNCPRIETTGQKVCRDCGVVVGVYFRVHDLRALSTTQQLSDNVNPAYVQYKGGWQDQAVMLKHYAKYLPADAEASSAAISKAFAAVAG